MIKMREKKKKLWVIIAMLGIIAIIVFFSVALSNTPAQRLKKAVSAWTKIFNGFRLR